MKIEKIIEKGSTTKNFKVKIELSFKEAEKLWCDLCDLDPSREYPLTAIIRRDLWKITHGKT